MKKALLLLVLGLVVILPARAQQWNNIGPGGGSDLHIIKFQPDNENIIYTGGDIEGIFKSTDGGQTWENINNEMAQGPYSANSYWINDIVFDPNNYQNVFVSSGAGLFKSTNGGQNWQELYVEIIDEEPTMVSTIAIDPNNSDVIYLGFGDRNDGAFGDYEPFPGYEGKIGLLKSTNGGQNWSTLNIPMPDSTIIHSIIMHNTDTVIVTTTNGVYRSNDGGGIWTQKNSGLPHVNCHIMKETDIWGVPTLFLTLKTLGTPGNANTFSGGFFRSDDLGDSWIDLTGNLPKYESTDSMFYDYWKFDIDPSYHPRILISPTRGSHWDEASILETYDADGNTPLWDFAYYPDGEAWIDGNWFGDPYAFDIAFAPSAPKHVLYTNIYAKLSTDSGYNFSPIYSDEVSGAWKGNGLELMNTDDIAFDPADADKIYVGYDDMGLFRSDDNANAFHRLDSHQDPVIGTIENADGIKDILIDPDNGDLYISRWQGSQGGYLADYTSGGIIFSDNEGSTQTDITNGAFIGRCDLTVDFQGGSAGNRTLYSGVYYDGLYKSSNSGASWQAANNGLNGEEGNIWEVALDPSNSQNLWLGMNHRGAGGASLFKSTDGAQNWTQVNAAPQGDIMNIHVTESGNILLCVTDNFDWATDGGVYLSEDDGDSWSKIFDYPFPLDVDVYPEHDDLIVVAASQSYRADDTFQQGVYLSTDEGDNWQRISQNMDHTYINFARFNPHTNGDIYAGTAGVVYGKPM